MGSLPPNPNTSKSILMRTLTATICVTLAVFFSSGEVKGSDLPECEDSPLSRVGAPSYWVLWDKCYGELIWSDWFYQGEWENGKFNGDGILILRNGEKQSGVWKLGNLQHKKNIKSQLFRGSRRFYSTQYPYTSPTEESLTTREKIIQIEIEKSRNQYLVEKSTGKIKLMNKQNEIEKLRKEIARLKKEKQSQPKQVAKKPPLKKSPPPKSGTTGSGFFVSKLGHIITNEHVVRQCGSVTVGDNANKQVTASVLEMDKRNDLALLRISSAQMASAETLSLISKLGAKKLGLKLVPLASGGLMRSDDIELGESVMVAGYPYGELYSNTIKVTGGMVSAVKGMGDNSAQFQMDAAVQPGNSGGPIYDENGNIVGVVIAQLNKLKVAKAIGSLPENVNFGIKASTVRQFLTSAGLPTKWSNRTEKKSTKELAQIAKHQTVMVVCNP